MPPWLVEEFFLELAQPAFGRADEIAHRRIGGAHLRKNLFGGHAAIHQPDTLGLAVLGFDAFQKALPRRLVGGVARQHLIGQGQAVRRDDEGDDHLQPLALHVNWDRRHLPGRSIFRSPFTRCKPMAPNPAMMSR